MLRTKLLAWIFLILLLSIASNTYAQKKDSHPNQCLSVFINKMKLLGERFWDWHWKTLNPGISSPKEVLSDRAFKEDHIAEAERQLLATTPLSAQVEHALLNGRRVGSQLWFLQNRDRLDRLEYNRASFLQQELGIYCMFLLHALYDAEKSKDISPSANQAIVDLHDGYCQQLNVSYLDKVDISYIPFYQ